MAPHVTFFFFLVAVSPRNVIFNRVLLIRVSTAEMQPPKEQSIRQKLGSILGLGASRAAPLPQKSYEELDRQERSIFFTADVLRVR